MTIIPAADLFSVRERVAVVTGASSGLGDRFARVLHEAGAHVVAAARRTDRLAALAADLPGLTTVTADVTVEADAERIVATALSAHGRLDILVNNAGGADSQRALDESVERFRAIVELNLVSLFHLSRLAGAHMVEAGSGSIINIASMLGLVASYPVPNASYTAAKGGVVQLTRELAVQWARKGVRVNAIAPGYFPSELTTDALGTESFARYVERNCPMSRVGRAGELDGALLYLASSASSYMTGHVLTVDGGWTAR